MTHNNLITSWSVIFVFLLYITTSKLIERLLFHVLWCAVLCHNYNGAFWRDLFPTTLLCFLFMIQSTILISLLDSLTHMVAIFMLGSKLTRSRDVAKYIMEAILKIQDDRINSVSSNANNDLCMPYISWRFQKCIGSPMSNDFEKKNTNWTWLLQWF